MKLKCNPSATVLLGTAPTAGLVACAAIMVVLNALSETHYVDANSVAPAPPYTNWSTAARVIQEAVDAAETGDEVLVTNGTYTTGGRAPNDSFATNRVTVDKSLILRSVAGPDFVIIDGGGSIG